jgi:hypothetical protein
MDEAEFLRRYEALCREAGMFVHGCGCCGSPYIAKVEAGGMADQWAKKAGFVDEIEENVKHLAGP